MTRAILTADDYALTDGVSRSIEALAHERRLSATSVMTGMPGWPEAAKRLAALRDRMSLGLHLNLTLGAPAGSMPRLAPAGAYPVLGDLMRQAFLRHLAPSEIAAEVDRQLDLFEHHLGHAPDHVDGHQHVHVLPTIRRAVVAALASRYKSRPPLLRVPVNRSFDPTTYAKAGLVAVLATGLARQAHAAGLPVNARFAGFSSFDTALPYDREIAPALVRTVDGRGFGVIMCHPGFADADLEAIDPVVERRRQEHDALMRLPHLPDLIWHAGRAADGAPIDWRAEEADA